MFSEMQNREARYELVVMGASLGGFHALGVMLDELPDSFPLPLAIVQHRSSDSDELLVLLLNRRCRLPIVEVEDKQMIAAGRVYVAPANYHLLVEHQHFALSTQAPVQFARPSIDVLFESAAEAYGERLIAVLLSGSNQDGARGMKAVKARGGLTIVQDPTTAESRQMPEAAIAVTQIDHILPLPEIAGFLGSVVCKAEGRL